MASEIIQLSQSNLIRQKVTLIYGVILEISMKSLAQFLEVTSDLKTEDNFSFQDRHEKNLLNNFKDQVPEASFKTSSSCSKNSVFRTDNIPAFK